MSTPSRHRTASHRRETRRARTCALTGLTVLFTLALVGITFVALGSGGDSAADQKQVAQERTDQKQPTQKQTRQKQPDRKQAGQEGVGRTSTSPVTEDQLLSVSQVRPLAPAARWRLLDTLTNTDNTEVTSSNSGCQAARFADPEGHDTLVRRFLAPGTTTRSYFQMIEISRTPAAAAAAYRTTLGWFAACTKPRARLLSTYRLNGLGQEGRLLVLRLPGGGRHTFLVGLARTGALTVTTVLETRNGPPVAIPRAVSVLTSAVGNVCGTDAVGPCTQRPTTPKAVSALPPPSGETTGSLAATDLPLMPRVNRPWVGTRPMPARPNPAATTCDSADFVRSGAPGAATRSFLIPGARLPERFGITETFGTFSGPVDAASLVRRTRAAMASCEKRDLGATVSNAATRRAVHGSEYALWRLDSEISPGTTVRFWTGVTRRGRHVAQVTFTPVDGHDLDRATFQGLLARASERLSELSPR